MHGREGEERKRRRHMWPVPALGTTSVAVDSAAPSVDFFCKDGRKISVGDCALFKPPQESPPFIGIIRWLTSGREDNLKLGVNWLYRPAEVKVGKGILLEAAPNEVFYSFHKDEIPAASLLHPCKVAFLRKGVELPSGISSFVCRRVYDIANRCLWWLTDQDYINERQEEVDQLLDKTQLEMHAGVQSGGRSPKPLNGPTSTPQLKPGLENLQNSANPVPSQGKGKKRERGDQVSEHVKRERSLKLEDGDSNHFRMESLKSEISRITDKGGLLDAEGVEKLVQLMQPDRGDKKIDLVGRIMLADVLSTTDRLDCLGRFVQLRGLPILDEWLQEVHKGKTGDGSSPKDSDRTVDEFLLALLRALDKLPVNLHALQNSNIGRSVNNLRSHKNLEIQKKARSLVDTWKKRVHAEMKINDAKSGSSQTVSWPTKPGFSEISHGGSRRTGGSSEVAIKSAVTQPSATKIGTVKVGHVEALSKFTPVSLGSVKLGSLSGSVGINSKDPHSKTAIGGAPLDIPVTIKEEKSSSSSQSQNNSQSYSSDHAKNVGSSWKEDARSSTAGSMNKVSGGSSRHRKSSNGYVGLSVTGVKKEISSAKCSSSNRNLVPEKVSQSGLTCERTPDMPPMDHGNSHRLIVRFPNPGRSPARSASGSSFEEPSMVNRGSSPGHSEKHDNDRKEEGKSDVCQTNVASDVNMESWQSNDVKVGVPVSDEGDGSPVTVFDKEHCKTGEESLKLVEASNVTSSWGHDPKSVKSYETPFSSINALIESCIKYSEAGASTTVGDDTGIGLLASVAAGEMSKSSMVSPVSSPGRNSPEDTCTGNDAKMISPCEEDVINECQQDVGTNDTEMQTKQGNTVVPQCNKELLHHLNIQVLTNASGECKSTSSIVEEKGGENSDHAHSSCMNLQQIGDSCLKCDGGSDEIVTSASVVSSSAEIQEEGTAGEGVSQMYEQRKVSGAVVNGGGVSELKHKARSALFDENKNFDSLDDRNTNSSQAVATSIVHGSVNEARDSSNVVSSVKLQEEALEESQLCSLSEMDCDHKNSMHEVHSGGIVTEQKPSAPLNCLDSVEGSNEDAVLSGSTDVLDTEKNDKLKAETVNDIGGQGDVDQDEKHLEWDGNDPPTDDGQIGAGLHPTLSDHSGEGLEEKSGGKEIIESHCGRSAPQEESPAKPVQESEQCVNSSELKLTALNANETPECVSIGNASSISVVGDDMAAKLDFDLNEGFPVDDANQGEPANSAAPGCSSAIHLPSPLPFAVSSMSSGLPASITVAAAAKGSFVPPENLLRNKVELGWKGSAATSAFRPAEPRKVLETPLSTAETFHVTAGKQGRPPLDIDLNVPDERVVEDMGSQSSGQRKVSDTGPVICGLARGEMFSCSPASIRSAGGLDFDLNRIDEGSDVGQIPSCSSQRLEFPLLPIKSSPAGFSNGEVSVLRNIDLNNGPVLDEMSTESAPRNHHSKNSMSFLSPVAGLRMTNTELGNISSWFPPGNSYSAVTIPSILPDRGEQPYPFVAPSGSQRIIGTPTGGINFGPDVYRGSVLSSSPSGAFTPATSFQCPGFPFGPNFSLPSTSFSSVSSYMDSSSGAALCFPTVPSPLVAPSGAVSPHFPRPYVISLSDSTSNGGAECNRKWGRQGLDLNAGPGGMDFEGRDERFSLRQLSVSSSQALAEQARMYQAAGGVPKRKEPEGGWDAERFSYKQSSWP